MLRYLYLVIFMVLVNVCVCFAVKTALPVKPKAVLQTDTAIVNIRYFNKNAINNYTKQTVFNYHEDAFEPSLWTRFWRWFWSWIASIFPSKHSSGGFFNAFIKYVFIVLGLGAIVFLLLKVMGIDMLNIFRRQPAPANLPYTEWLEDIHHIEFDSEIEKAAGQHNYRLAVRLLYLKCLKQLSDASLINWQPDKTNNAYVEELANAEQRNSFKQLTRQFEYVWYGEFPIDSAVFKNISLMFRQFKTIRHEGF